MARSGSIFYALIIALSFYGNPLHAQEVKNGLTWYTDINKASEISNKLQKPIFAFFTGSDWCGWCHRLEDNVFHKPGFQAWAQKNVILLELDFPRNKKLPDELVSQNAGLQQFFHVQGYPTIWMFYLAMDTTAKKGNITPIGSLMYPEAQAGKEEEAFLESANALLKKNKQ